ncbi:MAG: ATP-dependent zinc metalloprotease FtsH [Parachlamydiaceae bacterium]|nr:ATP-dependent zinc metalloprotease FtsH [Parachlamydiaceae bacterium]
MSDDKKQDLKKNVPGGLLWIVMAILLLAMMVQNFVETKFAQVSFSYQLEHLVNLQLLQPEDSRKIALNDNLVTFSGKFRDHATDEGKQRYKFLDLLNTSHEQTSEKERLQKILTEQKTKVLETSEWFLALSGEAIPTGGFTVIDDLSLEADKNYTVDIKENSKKSPVNLTKLTEILAQLQASPSEVGAEAYGKSLDQLLRDFRSPLLGVGNQTMKEELKTLDDELTNTLSDKSLPVQSKVDSFASYTAVLQKIVNELSHVNDDMRLSQLRSVRNYKETLDENNALQTKIEETTLQLDRTRQNVNQVTWFVNGKELSTRALEKLDPELYSQWFTAAKHEWEGMGHNHGGYFKAPDQPLNIVLEKTFKSEEPSPNYLSYLFTMLPVLLVLSVLYFIFSRQVKGMGSNAMSFGKSPAKLLVKGQNKITFKDVAGVDEAIEELQEIVEFLKSPHKFTALGGRIPKGVLCVGPPGTGKTLIAKAVAGEADRPFFSISGSDFVEMFVGVGASRIRDLFDQAKKNAPCIIFMDEIDAVGRHRGAGVGGGHDEREQTLNQLLVEMDGFDTNEGVILMAATNRPDVLDRALLRPGRFDRRVIINLPDVKGRFDILNVHARKIKLDPNVDMMLLARSTPGCSGADLANMLNEAALLAARKGRTAITGMEIFEARDKVLYGKERRSLEIDENEKRTTAYHEAGHTIVGLIVKHADPVEKVTIIPRGMSLGSTLFTPKKNKVSYWKMELHDQLAVLMGGRCAEEIFVGDVSSGAQQDIERATAIARKMVCEWGMTDALGAMAYDKSPDSNQYSGMGSYHEKEYSEETAKTIDKEVRKILDDANARAASIITEHKPQVELMTEMLIKYETLSAEDIDKILKNEWSENDKDARLLKQDELHKKAFAPDKEPPAAPGSASKKHPPLDPIQPGA